MRKIVATVTFKRDAIFRQQLRLRLFSAQWPAYIAPSRLASKLYSLLRAESTETEQMTFAAMTEHLDP